jgi:hypothetical protein
MTTPTNLRVLQPSREKRLPGDIFALQVRAGEYLYGRLIRADARVLPGVDCNLVYIYRFSSRDPRRVSTLLPTELLIAPALVNQKPWTLGYFQKIEHRPLLADVDVLPGHCFVDSRGKHHDELGREQSHRRDVPCGVWGVGNHRTVDDDVSRALGIPLASEAS